MIRKSPKKPVGVPPIFLRVKRGLNARLQRVCKKHEKDRIEVARDGLISEIGRLEAKVPGLSQRVAKAVIEAERAGVPVLDILAHATISALNPPPPTPPANINSAG